MVLRTWCYGLLCSHPPHSVSLLNHKYFLDSDENKVYPFFDSSSAVIDLKGPFFIYAELEGTENNGFSDSFSPSVLNLANLHYARFRRNRYELLVHISFFLAWLSLSKGDEYFERSITFEARTALRNNGPLSCTNPDGAGVAALALSIHTHIACYPFDNHSKSDPI
ncbi:hypothetical protein Moror_4388 [Moniliophthora roreri MCA 2997]|uniref:Uncharacterized protein n=1 Tax=Moniliophthora roreri (strain MCA 2997) TaxID=1381753 RepID=V2YLK8_MONRO|nr:hypothetical protein Moror_4388 [Moniliophthora roreri MCA 2997]